MAFEDQEDHCVHPVCSPAGDRFHAVILGTSQLLPAQLDYNFMASARAVARFNYSSLQMKDKLLHEALLP